MNNYIASISFTSNDGLSCDEKNIVFPVPEESGTNSITAICGKNNIGKSHILREIYGLTREYNFHLKEHPNDTNIKNIENDNISLEVSNPSQLFHDVLMLEDFDQLKSQFGRYLMMTTTEFNTSSLSNRFCNIAGDPNEAPHNHYFELFMAEAINFVLTSNSEKSISDKEKPLNSFNILDKNLKYNNIYKINDCNDMAKQFGLVTNGALYISMDSTQNMRIFSIYLVFYDGKQLPFVSWSEGTKKLFIYLVVLYYAKPLIFLLDEIDKSLHPEFTSLLLVFIKQYAKQAILTTHDPHVIFSHYVDCVWYLEVKPKVTILPKSLNRLWVKQISNPPVRYAKNLKKNYQKLSTVYQLFNNYDNYLIDLSSSVSNDLTDICVDMFTTLFNYGVIDPLDDEGKKLKTTPDAQTKELYKYFVSKIRSNLDANESNLISKNKKIKVLEIGAGKGRLLIEVNRLGDQQTPRMIEWNLFEPKEEIRAKLRDNIKDLENYNITVLDKLSNENNCFDTILLVNVIHELIPEQIAEHISYASTALKKDGDLIVVELYPLLKPEGLSVPYRGEELNCLFWKLKWIAGMKRIFLGHKGYEAYWIRATPNQNTLDNAKQITNIISEYWKNDILNTRSQDYITRSKWGQSDVDEIVTTMCELTSIASISSYINGLWRR